MKKILVLTMLMMILSSILIAQKTVKCVGVDWAPYIGDDLEDMGFYAEITKEAFKKAGYDATIELYPWNRAVAMVKEGKADCLTTVYFNKERTAYFEYSDEVSQVQLVFYKKKDRNISYQTLPDLQNYSIGTMAGFAHTEEFDNATYLKKDPTQKIDQLIKKLIHGRVDIIVESKLILQHEINNNFPEYKDKLDILDPPLKIQGVYNTFSKKIPNTTELLNAFNKGLAEIKADGTYDKIMEKHGF